MNDGFKQRLVGAIVLGSLALIVWPLVFTQATGPEMSRRSQIPLSPQFKKYTINAPTHPENIDPIAEDSVVEDSIVEKSIDNAIDGAVSQNGSPSEHVKLSLGQDKPTSGQIKSSSNQAKPSSNQTTAAEQAIRARPQLDSRGLPKSWVLQVASFEKGSNAVELKNSLQKKGYKAYTRRVKTAVGESVRVYVGPKLSKTGFDADKKAIDKEFKLNSLVVRFKQ